MKCKSNDSLQKTHVFLINQNETSNWKSYRTPQRTKPHRNKPIEQDMSDRGRSHRPNPRSGEMLVDVQGYGATR